MRHGWGLYACGLAGAIVLAGFASPDQKMAPRSAVEVAQGWTAHDIEAWSGAYQGSRLVPEAWLYALEQPAGDGLFLDGAYIASFGYISGSGRLPVGFAVDRQSDSGFMDTKLRWRGGQGPDEPWVGMTCAACHTNDISAGGKTIRVYGGSTLADFQGFIEAFDQALARTRDDPAKFARFADRVLGATASDADRQRLRGALDQLVTLRRRNAALDRTEIRYGPARLDAVGYIFNKVELVANPDAPEGPPPDAPVSYPFLWNVSQQTQIQWDGVGTNTPIRIGRGQAFDAGALGRNLAEVTGVFGEVDIPARNSAPFVTSIHVNNLVAIEQQLARLKAPLWPRDVFPVDEALAQEGRTLYGARCASCHVELARDDLRTRHRPDGRPLETMSYMEPQKRGESRADTDPWMACNAAMDQAPTGRLEGRRTGSPDQPRFGPTGPMTLMLRSVVVSEMLSKKGAITLAALQSFTNTHSGPLVFAPTPAGVTAVPQVGASPGEDFARQQRLSKCEQAAASKNYKAFAYKARPLNGVWATGPYLHNGSVPTLYDLLLPPSQRPTSFNLGSRQLDERKVGFVTAPGPDNRFAFHVRDADGRIIAGNSNQGHDYNNAALSEHQRLALVEYLKVIGER